MKYIALQELLFGEEMIPAGQEVPFEDGRDYAQLLRLKLIAVIPNASDNLPNTVFQVNDLVSFFDADGKFYQDAIIKDVDQGVLSVEFDDQEFIIAETDTVSPRVASIIQGLFAELADALEQVAAQSPEELEQTDGETLLPDDFPAKSLLEQAGLLTLEQVAAQSPEELEAIKGIGAKRVQEILDALKV